MADPFYLGVGRRIINPLPSSQMYGYMPDVYAQGIHDDLTVTAFYFCQNQTQALLLNATLCLIHTPIADQLRQDLEESLGIPKNNILVHTTHTHSGPNTGGTPGWGDIDRGYYESILRPRMLEAAKEALSSAVPAQMAVTQGESKVGINRRQIGENGKVYLGQNPWGPYDPRMTVIQFADATMRPLASLIHYGCHQTAAGRNTQISRDWSGVMIDVMEREYQNAPCAFFNGPEGDVGPRLTNGQTNASLSASHAAFADELGAVAAQDAIRIAGMPKMYFTPSLKVSHTRLSLPLGPRASREEALNFLKKHGDKSKNLGGTQVVHYRKVLDSYDSAYQEQKEALFEQSAIFLGDLAFLAFPFELFSEIGLRIRADSPFAYTLPLSLCNGNYGYFVTKEQLCRKGYEVEVFKTMGIQPLADDADSALVQETLRHLRQMK